MSRLRKLSVLLLAIALVMFISGWILEENYSGPQARSVAVNSETFPLAANQTAYRSIPLDTSGDYTLYVSIPKDSGTVFSATLSNQSLQNWLNSNYNVSWAGTEDHGNYGPYRMDFWRVVNDSSDVANVVFWNPETATQQVNFKVSRDWYESNPAGYYAGIALMAAGILGFLAAPVAWTLKNRAKVVTFKWTGKKGVSLLIAIILLAGGLWAANTYSHPLQGQETVSKGIIPLAANGQQCITYQEQTGDYTVQVDADIGFVEVYVNNENGTVGYWQNGTTVPMAPNFNGTSGTYTFNVWVEENHQVTRYIVFNNPDSASKDVSYEVSRYMTYSNYFGLTAGIAATAAGAIALALVLLQDKLRNFNRALDNQE
jgi:hypothetical protein